MMTVYTKLGADGSDLPADATDHQAVRIQNPMLVAPIIVTAAKAPEEMTWADAKKWAESLTINGWSWAPADGRGSNVHSGSLEVSGDR